jgi:hypothetical protein
MRVAVAVDVAVAIDIAVAVDIAVARASSPRKG